jgi:lipoprotein NlpD
MRAADSASNTASNTARPASAAAAPAAVATAPRAAEPTRSTEAASSGPLEWSWPVNGRVVQGFAETSKGIALGGSSGDSVLAAADGKVIFSGNGPRGYGNLVIVKHANDMLSVYAHNRSLAVKEGQVVKKGQKVAELGDTGGSSPRLHFEIRQQGKPVDPLTVLPKR